jgi:hypothetical protein
MTPWKVEVKIIKMNQNKSKGNLGDQTLGASYGTRNLFSWAQKMSILMLKEATFIKNYEFSKS